MVIPPTSELSHFITSLCEVHFFPLNLVISQPFFFLILSIPMILVVDSFNLEHPRFSRTLWKLIPGLGVL